MTLGHLLYPSLSKPLRHPIVRESFRLTAGLAQQAGLAHKVEPTKGKKQGQPDQ